VAADQDYLPLSGLQHFLFCRRQWALIQVESQWKENYYTIDGKLLHEKVDDPFFNETRSGVVISRSVPIKSDQLGFAGVCDLVEFSASPQGIPLPGRQGLYQPAVVEYKRGKPKDGDFDEAQVCAQSICLEEMLSATIDFGWIYYGLTRRRIRVDLTEELRETVYRSAKEMRDCFRRKHTPRVKTHKGCRTCSLADLCLPELLGPNMDSEAYIRRHLDMD
jgi:CRISPR-associated exonuclease Cas4